jgi:hypothetical protein
MLERPPARHDRDRDRDRARWRSAKRTQRQRERGGIRRVPILIGEIVIEAIIAQGIDAGMSADEACRQSRNRKQVAAALASLISEWARTYLAARAKR